MKKLFLILAATFLLTGLSHAQLFQFGIKGGVGFSQVDINSITDINDGSDVYDLITGDGVTGYHIGLQTRVNVLMLFAQPELYFNAGGGTVEKVVDGGASEILDISFSRIDIPVLFGFKLGPLRLGAGPVASIAVSEVSDLTTLDPDFALYDETFNWGWQGGLGVDLLGFSLDVRYEGPLSDLSGAMELTGVTSPVTMDPRPQQWIISLGYWFGKD